MSTKFEYEDDEEMILDEDYDDEEDEDDFDDLLEHKGQNSLHDDICQNNQNGGSFFQKTPISKIKKSAQKQDISPDSQVISESLYIESEAQNQALLQHQSQPLTLESQSQPLKAVKSKRSAESKKLVFLSKKVLEEVMHHRETTGTNIARRILEIYRSKRMCMDFKNVQRRVYDALNVLSALGIIHKDRNRIHYRGILRKEVKKEEKKQSEIQNQNIQYQQKQEKLKKLLEQIEKQKDSIYVQKQLLQEQIIQQTAIKKLIYRNFHQKQNNTQTQNPIIGDTQRTRRSSNTQEFVVEEAHMQIPFIGFIQTNEKILVQINGTKDIASIFCQDGDQVQPFTENDILKKIGLTKTDMPELKELIKPQHLKFVSNMLGIEEEQLEEEPAAISAPVSGGQLSLNSSQSQNSLEEEENYHKQYERFKKFYQKYHKKESQQKKVNIGYFGSSGIGKIVIGQKKPQSKPIRKNKEFNYLLKKEDPEIMTPPPPVLDYGGYIQSSQNQYNQYFYPEFTYNMFQ